jgi:hypothetical protein
LERIGVLLVLHQEAECGRTVYDERLHRSNAAAVVDEVPGRYALG